MTSKVLTKRRIKRRLVSKKAKRKVRTMRKHRPLSNKLMRMSQRGGARVIVLVEKQFILLMMMMMITHHHHHHHNIWILLCI